MTLSKSSWHVPLLTNLDGFHNQSLYTSHVYSIYPSSSYTPGGNISRAANSNNKVVMIGQVPYNNGKINAIPIITYHDLTYNIQDYNRAGTTITVPLFDQEMQYLHDNGFKVLLLNQFGFDPNNNVFYLKNVPSSNVTATNAGTLQSGAVAYSIALAK